MSWAYASIPSVQEILVVRTAGIGDHPLRRNRDGSWPDRALAIGELKLESGALGTPLAAAYRIMRLAANS